MRSGIGHATSDTRRAEAAALTRKGYESVVAARFAADPKEAELQKSALQVCAQLPLDEARDGASRSLAERQEGLELFKKHAVERRLLREVAARLGLVRSAVGVGGERELARHTEVDCEARALLQTGERRRGGWM